jgi:hypothetical protein
LLDLRTDPGTEGWWYHGTDERTGNALRACKKAVKSPFYLSKNPRGASQRHGKCAVRCTVLLNKAQQDKYFMKGEGEGLDRGYAWLEVIEGTIFIDRDYIDCQHAGPAATDKQSDAGQSDAAPPIEAKKFVRRF